MHFKLTQVEAPGGGGCAVSPRSASVRWTPLHIELMIHYRCSPARLTNQSAPAVVDYTADLHAHGLIEDDNSRESGWSATERGEAFIEALCRTQLPEKVWSLPDGSFFQPNIPR